ncbi:MAG: hypothetical protein H6923_10655 [Alphaproteobacteria bacterium]|nr:hypothetical protein [Alphaproteobacteria bacterium]
MRGKIAEGIWSTPTHRRPGALGHVAVAFAVVVALTPYLNGKRIVADLGQARAFAETHRDEIRAIERRLAKVASNAYGHAVDWLAEAGRNTSAARASAAEGLEALALRLTGAQREPVIYRPRPAPGPFERDAAVAAVRNGVTVPLRQEERLALIAVAQSMGPETFLASKGLKRLNEGNAPGALAAFRDALEPK